MSQIRGKNTKPELIFRKALWALGMRYRLHAKLAGRPDIVFAKAKVAVFIDGCFWHGCPIHCVKAKTNKDFWERKLSGNVERDKTNSKLLRKEGWKVFRFWEHEIKEDAFRYAKKVAAEVRRKKDKVDAKK